MNSPDTKFFKFCTFCVTAFLIPAALLSLLFIPQSLHVAPQPAEPSLTTTARWWRRLAVLTWCSLGVANRGGADESSARRLSERYLLPPPIVSRLTVHHHCGVPVAPGYLHHR